MAGVKKAVKKKVVKKAVKKTAKKAVKRVTKSKIQVSSESVESKQYKVEFKLGNSKSIATGYVDGKELGSLNKQGRSEYDYAINIAVGCREEYIHDRVELGNLYAAFLLLKRMEEDGVFDEIKNRTTL